jgi:patatin-like phospholipase/acyl hydrolase
MTTKPDEGPGQQGNVLARPFRVLSVDGGGYLGLAAAAFLNAAENHFGSRASDRFDLFCGTSTGAIVALGLAAGKSAEEVVSLYEELGTSVFWNPWPFVHSLRKALGFFTARYSSKPLAKALQQAFDDMSLADIRKGGKLALITAFNVSTGRPRLFKTDHSQRLTTDAGYRIRDIALASAAAPTFLPMVELKAPVSGVSELYCDGGVFANHPALLGFIEAVYELKHPPEQVQVLSVSTPRYPLGEPTASRSWFAKLGIVNQLLLKRGVLLWGSRLSSILIDAPADVSHEALRRLAAAGGSGYERIQLAGVGGLEIDLATPETTSTLKLVGMTEANRNEVRDRLRSFFVG